MATRQQLQNKLEDLLGSRNVYYQPPETVKMQYPAIVYSKSNIKSTFANNAVYSYLNCYEIIVIDKKPDNAVLDKLVQLPYCAYGRNYKFDGLNHDTFTIFY